MVKVRRPDSPQRLQASVNFRSRRARPPRADPQYAGVGALDVTLQSASISASLAVGFTLTNTRLPSGTSGPNRLRAWSPSHPSARRDIDWGDRHRSPIRHSLTGSGTWESITGNVFQRGRTSPVIPRLQASLSIAHLLDAGAISTSFYRYRRPVARRHRYWAPARTWPTPMSWIGADRCTSAAGRRSR